MLLSICIPTYNRPQYLDNCLNSILTAKKNNNIKFEVCVSDNGSKEKINHFIKFYKKKINIKFNRFKKNRGFAINMLKTISMAEGEYVWVIGNDDLLLPNTFEKLDYLLNKNSHIDFFYINSYHLSSNFLEKFSKPFNTKNLPSVMKRFSLKKKNEFLDFWDLINPKVSYDFLLGIFLTIFRREMFIKNMNVINQNLIKDKRLWSNLDNTAPHAKIFANAFSKSKAYFHAKPLSVNLHGVREWASLYAFVEIARIPELLDYYRSKGLNFFQYIYCKNFALRNFLNFFVKIFVSGKKSGSNYVNFSKHIFKNLIYPNVYLSLFYFIFRKINFYFNINKE
jgi:glycosyltransferase involved in cell wall biosynthesis